MLSSKTTPNSARCGPAARRAVPAVRRVRAMASTTTTPSYTWAEGKFDIKQADQVKVGQKLPLESDFLVLDEGQSDPRAIKVGDITKGKKVVFFGLPGAYTSVCSSKHVPQYNERLEKLREAGVDTVACLSVNDPWVMREWAKQLNVPTDRVLMLADGEGIFHCKLGLLQHIPGLGVRSLRYSMLVDDGVVKILNLEEPGGKSYKYSGPDNMLKSIAELN